MIIASIRHTQLLSNYGVNYIFDGISDEPEHQWLIFQNISRGFTRKDIIDSFNDNARYLTKNPKRKRCYRYHEVLAFSPENSKDLTRAKLQTITNEYLRLRDPKGLSKAVCVPHIEQGKHYHVHLLLTSNHLESERSSDMMMTNEQYYDLRRSMERYVLRTMPELHQSTVYLNEQEIQERLPHKYRSQRRLLQLQKPAKKRNHQKDKVAEIVHDLVRQSNTIEEFETLINNTPDIQTYRRDGNGKLTGIIYKRKNKFRWKTLGIPLFKENFHVLKRMAELKKITEREQSNELER
ncbi:MAG: hypothetical protein GKR88_15360 [Flavobacteriaceae bacterium]|nr:MAG: hypothetical protein GKR88_15360 [Flavobacteriaceae bacterium]